MNYIAILYALLIASSTMFLIVIPSLFLKKKTLEKVDDKVIDYKALSNSILEENIKLNKQNLELVSENEILKTRIGYR